MNLINNSSVNKQKKNLATEEKVSFTGLNRTFSKNVFKTPDTIQKLTNFHSSSNNIVGNIPSEFIQNVPKNLRAEKISEFYKSMNESIHRLRNKGLEMAESNVISQLFAKLGMPVDKFNLKYLDSRNWGSAYQMQGVSGDKYVLKLFHVKDLGVGANGNGFEQAVGAFWKKNIGQESQITPFYFGDIDAGYMITKFVDEKSSALKRFVHPEVYGLRSSDVSAKNVLTGHNKINGIQFEYGSMNVIEPQLLRDKNWQKEINNFFDSPLEKKLELIENSSQRSKTYFAKIVDALEADEKIICFEKMAKSKDNKVLANLTEHFDILNAEEKMLYFQKFMQNSDVEIRKGFLSNIEKLPQQEKLSILVNIANYKDPELVDQLTQRLPMLPKSSYEQSKAVFDAIFSNPKDKNLSHVASFIIYFPEGTRAYVYNKLIQSGSDAVHNSLVFSSSSLPKEDFCKSLCELYKKSSAQNKTRIENYVNNFHPQIKDEFRASVLP